MSGADPRPIVLIHGLGSASSFWDNVLGEFPGRQVITLDLPGHGPGAGRLSAAEAHPRALAEALAAQLEGDGVEQPHLVGLSLGGWVVLELGALGVAASVTALAPAGLWTPGKRIKREWLEGLSRHGLVPFRPLFPLIAHSGLIRHLGLRNNAAHPERVSAEQFAAAALALSQAQGYEVCDRAAVTNTFEGKDDIGFSPRATARSGRSRPSTPNGSRSPTVGTP
jgi:pimeloyl-ACP methyl ester carboxylesterase